MHLRTKRHRVYRQIKHISVDSQSLSYCLQLYQLTPNVADSFDIHLHIGSWGFFAVIGLVYTVVCVDRVFLKLPARRQAGRACIVLSPTCLGISDRRCDCVTAQPSRPGCRLRPLFTYPSAPPALLSSLPHPLFPECCMVSTWPSERLPFVF